MLLEAAYSASGGRRVRDVAGDEQARKQHLRSCDLASILLELCRSRSASAELLPLGDERLDLADKGLD